MYVLWCIIVPLGSGLSTGYINSHHCPQLVKKECIILVHMYVFADDYMYCNQLEIKSINQLLRKCAKIYEYSILTP